MSDKLIIFDTTLRDGEQTPLASLNTVEKIEIARQLELLGVDVIEAGFPVSSPGDFQSVYRVSKEIKNAAVCGLTRAVLRDIDVAAEALKPAQYPRIHTGIGASDRHIKDKLHTTREDVLERGVAAVRHALKYVGDVEFYCEDAGRADSAFLATMVEAVIEAGAKTVNIPDTTGYTFPEEFGALIAYLFEHVSNIHRAVISVHCHNDLGLATANSLAGIAAGARQVEVTMNGIGERAGNTSLEEVVMALKTRKKSDLAIGINTKLLVPTSRLVSSMIGIIVQPNKAIVGANAFAHSSGIHQDGVIKSRENYEIIDPKTVGADSSKIILTARSGRAAIQHRLEKLGYKKLTKKVLDTLYERFLVLADQKKEIYDEDLRLLIGDATRSKDNKLKLDLIQVTCGNGLVPMSAVKLSVDGEVTEETAKGTGPVDAAFSAINKIVKRKVVLHEYLVQAVTEGIDAQARVSVAIEYKKQRQYGYGSSTDIIVASALAYLDALNKTFRE